ncbi:Uncharacterized protein conserved in bacteria [Moraxella lacunata]|uniref:Uncharacterized protein conserved in bacteria n=2 Tax=Moraxella lacunata TaxID=477 RepID=A0A378QHB0_MORLA|nr:Uncharacterized protein conserved in bacteria [Moraxella lacunata]
MALGIRLTGVDMHHYQFHINDFNASTRHLSHVERALYRDLIDMYYSTEKPITADLVRLERVLLVKTDDEKQALQNVLADFFVVKKLKGDAEPCYHNARIDREIKNYKHRQTSSNKNQTPSNEHQTPSNDCQTDSDRQTTYKNKVAFLVKSLKDKGIKANARMKIADLQTLFDTHCKQTSNEHQTPSNTSNEHQTAFEQSITINHKPLTNNQSNISPQTPQGAGVIDKTDKTDEKTKATAKKTHPTSDTDKTLNVPFEAFWDSYDKKIDPKKCKPLWERLSDKDRLDIMAYLPRYKQSQPDKQYRKNPQTFLNARSWESEIITAQTYDQYGNLVGANHARQSNHQPHPNSTTAYVNRLEQEAFELKRELYPEQFGAFNR